jgi:hypothetical protein
MNPEVGHAPLTTPEAARDEGRRIVDATKVDLRRLRDEMLPRGDFHTTHAYKQELAALRQRLTSFTQRAQPHLANAVVQPIKAEVDATDAEISAAITSAPVLNEDERRAGAALAPAAAAGTFLATNITPRLASVWNIFHDYAYKPFINLVGGLPSGAKSLLAKACDMAGMPQWAAALRSNGPAQTPEQQREAGTRTQYRSLKIDLKEATGLELPELPDTAPLTPEMVRQLESIQQSLGGMSLNSREGRAYMLRLKPNLEGRGLPLTLQKVRDAIYDVPLAPGAAPDPLRLEMTNKFTALQTRVNAKIVVQPLAATDVPATIVANITEINTKLDGGGANAVDRAFALLTTAPDGAGKKPATMEQLLVAARAL